MFTVHILTPIALDLESGFILNRTIFYGLIPGLLNRRLNQVNGRKSTHLNLDFEF